MPKWTDAMIDVGRFGRRVIEADFSGGDLSSDGGLLLLRQVDAHLGLSRAAAAAIPDPRDPERITQSLRDLVAQRVDGLCCGDEDLNDHKALRGDVLMQTAAGRDEALASAPTSSRLENRATRAQAWALHEVLAAQFIASHDRPPGELVLDIDASGVPLHGAQELGAFHASCGHHCFLWLDVFCGQAMLACVLRPSKIDGARHAAAVIKLLVSRLRRAWPATRFIVRADSGFCRRRLLQWCERSGVGYIVGLARNARLHAAVEMAEVASADAHQASRTKRRLIGEFACAAKSWPHGRRVITRLEIGDQGTNPRFVVTNLQGESQALYDGRYCQRGEAETASRKRSAASSARAGVARASSPTRSACCWQRSAHRSASSAWPARCPRPGSHPKPGKGKPRLQRTHTCVDITNCLHAFRTRRTTPPRPARQLQDLIQQAGGGTCGPRQSSFVSDRVGYLADVCKGRAAGPE